MHSHWLNWRRTRHAHTQRTLSHRSPVVVGTTFIVHFLACGFTASARRLARISLKFMSGDAEQHLAVPPADIFDSEFCVGTLCDSHVH